MVRKPASVTWISDIADYKCESRTTTNGKRGTPTMILSVYGRMVDPEELLQRIVIALFLADLLDHGCVVRLHGHKSAGMWQVLLDG